MGLRINPHEEHLSQLATWIRALFQTATETEIESGWVWNPIGDVFLIGFFLVLWSLHLVYIWSVQFQCFPRILPLALPTSFWSWGRSSGGTATTKRPLTYRKWRRPITGKAHDRCFWRLLLLMMMMSSLSNLCSSNQQH